MKKIFKFSGNKEGKTAYLTAVFVPAKSLDLQAIANTLKRSRPLSGIRGYGEASFPENIAIAEHVTRTPIDLDIEKNSLIIMSRYDTDRACFGDDLPIAEKDANCLVEQIETLINALEEETD